jgi:signal transduction histidine kinase
MPLTSKTKILEEVNRLRRRVIELENSDITDRKRSENEASTQVNRLRELSKISVALVGDPLDIFSRIAAMIAQFLGARVVCLSEIRGDELHFVAVCVDGEVMTNAGRCPLNITPCATVERTKDMRVYDHVMERFPEASFLKDHNATAYCGFPSLDSNGNVIAVTCVLDSKPITFSETDKDLLRILGQRIAAEFEQQKLQGEQRRAEEERRIIEAELHHAQKMEAVGQLASGVAHEFNNLLVGIRGNAELLINTSSDLVSEQSRSALKDIARAGARAHVLTNQLLSLARKKSPSVTTLDVNRVVTDSERMLVKLIGPDITLNSVASANPALVRVNETELAQVILNLVLNARDALPNRGTIIIRTRVVTLGDRDVPKDCKARHFVELSVSDDGCGMPPETRERIFDPFFTTKSVGEGTGLGLSVAYSDISRNGGFLAVDSREGVGTVVSVFLPQAPELVVDTSDEGLGPPTNSVGGDETILVCDDEEIVLSSLKALLKSVGYSVIAVESAADALAAAETHDRKISLLLTDMTMPRMNGIQLGRKMSQRHPNMKVLYTSGYVSDHVVAGDSVEVFLKGGPTCELLQRVRQILDEGRPVNGG